MRDVFSREAELIASIAYEWRHYLQHQLYFRLQLCDEKVLSLIAAHFSEDDKAQYMQKVDFITKAGVSIYHIYYNIVAELAEQIRKV